MRFSPVQWAPVFAAALVMLSGCATGSLATTETTPRSSNGTSTSTTAPTGPTLIVTVPDLVPTTSVSAIATMETAPAQTDAPPVVEPATDAPAVESVPAQVPIPEPADPAEANQPAPAPAPAPEPAAAAGEGLNVSLANCDGCAVLATHRGVTGDVSAALVVTSAGRAILLSVAADGQVNGVIGVPYGAAFPAPGGGVLACAQGRCVVQGRQIDGRAILSAFELTTSGAWRDVSGDDAFPSATERAAVVDLGGELGIVVQDQGDGAAVWMLYTWDGERYAVIGCAADGEPPTAAGAVSPDVCLS